MMPVTTCDISEFLYLAKSFPVFDVRSPSEYKHAHIPGALSLPLFDDEQRKVIGTTYKQVSREEAIKVGMDYFGPKLKSFIEEAEKVVLAHDGNADKKILVDTGCGSKLSEKLQKIYNLDYSKHTLLTSLSAAGVEADEITDVILTHLHFDHAGGTTHLENGQAVPSFPNAKYYVQKDHLAWARNPTEKDRASFFKDNWEPMIGAGMMEILEGNGEIYKGLSVEQFIELL